MTNPYDPPASVPDQRRYFGDSARLVRGGFLYREIQVLQPVEFRFVYSGWNFVQRIWIDDLVVWRRISWAVIHRRAEFTMPAAVDPLERAGAIEIAFTRSLRFRRFRVTLGDVPVWDE